ncbi:MAG: hypothetical protein SGJ03_03375 [Alphaproteobacteria bacterium]|nr:hypothetical protein [Alphaproteobacteria bacterium]
MSFIFRTIFWLTLAVVILPPQQRVGGRDTADFNEIDVELELHNAAYAAWSLATNALNACDPNPELCKASTELWQTTWTTVTRMAMTRQELEGSSDVEAIAPAEKLATVEPD